MDWKFTGWVLDKLLRIAFVLIVVGFGVYCAFHSRYVEALLSGIYLELVSRRGA